MRTLSTDDESVPSPIEEAGTRLSKWRQTTAAFRYRNYRLWFLGQLVSLFGTWMQATAQGFLVYELTRSPIWLGYVGFAGGLPNWFLTLYGGVVADRIHRRTLLVITQASMMILAFVLAGLTFTGLVRPWHLLLLAMALGVTNSFDAPARHAFASDLVDRQDLTNAIALNATMFNTATVLGPAAAGLIYALIGPAWCFAINGLTYVAVIAALLFMRFEARNIRARSGSTWAELRTGWRYSVTHPMILILLTVVTATSLFGISFATLVPAWAVKVLHGDAKVNGWLQAARGVGALLGAIAIASLGRFKFRGRLLSMGMLAFPLFMAAMSLTRWLPLSLLWMAGAGGSSILVLNLANSLVQTQADDALRGRVMGVYSLVFFGSMPLGALFFGSLAAGLGEPRALLLGAAASLATALVILGVVPRLRALE